ncbi:hypothetical protein MTER_19540 [Mycolicibacter terrae]|uniref:Uncharacterized protein n=1 Tax=Mycolicibacter terrae TaxID=1788 RepID=A0AAD1MGI1_9MYCO|nr:hypothetical protein MTER_19540 [Mycolicibacter terrae]
MVCLARCTASAAAFSQDDGLVPMMSITRYTLMYVSPPLQAHLNVVHGGGRCPEKRPRVRHTRRHAERRRWPAIDWRSYGIFVRTPA